MGIYEIILDSGFPLILYTGHYYLNFNRSHSLTENYIKNRVSEKSIVVPGFLKPAQYRVSSKSTECW